MFNYGKRVKKVEVFDIRFPTSLSGDGSDAVHTDPDYSVCYVVRVADLCNFSFSQMLIFNST